MNHINLSALKTWLTDDNNVLETIAKQRREESPAEAVPVMVGVFVVGMALGTLGAMFAADALTPVRGGTHA